MSVAAETYETVYVRRKFTAKKLVDGNHRTKLPEYGIWTGIIARCSNQKHKNYKRYGGRGIGVCQAWRDDFENFYRDMGPRPSGRHSIDRVDNDRGYEPGNCRWATPREQVLNRDMRAVAWTTAEYATLRRMYEGYSSMREIAAALDRSIPTIQLHIFKEGLKRDGFITRLANQNPDLRYLITEVGRDAFVQAVTDRKTARRDKAKADREAHINGIKERAATIIRSSESRNEKMRLLREAGLNLTQIGRHFGLTRERVRQIEAKGFPTEEAGTGDRRKISSTNPVVLQKKIDRLCRAWNFASREARLAFLRTAPEHIFSSLSAETVLASSESEAA
jgi:DNA-binding MarR family transcriptional regulator